MKFPLTEEMKECLLTYKSTKCSKCRLVCADIKVKELNAAYKLINEQELVIDKLAETVHNYTLEEMYKNKEEIIQQAIKECGLEEGK